MSEVWLQMSDTNIDRENPSDLPALLNLHASKTEQPPEQGFSVEVVERIAAPQQPSTRTVVLLVPI